MDVEFVHQESSELYSQGFSQPDLASPDLLTSLFETISNISLMDVSYFTLPDLLRVSQTCKAARFLKPLIFSPERTLDFRDGKLDLFSAMWVLHKFRISVYEMYLDHYDLPAEGYWYYKNQHPYNLFVIIEAAKNDDVEFIMKSEDDEERSDPFEELEYYWHYTPDQKEVLEAWKALDWSPQNVWDLAWWYGGPKVREYLLNLPPEEKMETSPEEL